LKTQSGIVPAANAPTIPAATTPIDPDLKTSFECEDKPNRRQRLAKQKRAHGAVTVFLFEGSLAHRSRAGTCLRSAG
jgi:hypothetical protein